MPVRIIYGQEIFSIYLTMSEEQLQGCLNNNFIPTTFVGEEMCPFKSHVTLAPPLMLYIFTHCHLFIKLQTVLGWNGFLFFF